MAESLPELVHRSYPRATLAHGNVTWLDAMPLHVPPTGEQVEVTLIEDDGSRRVVTGHYYPFDHLAGGTLLLDPDLAHLGEVLIDAGGRKYESRL